MAARLQKKRKVANMGLMGALGAMVPNFLQVGADIWSAQYQAKKSLEAQGREFDWAERMSNTAHQREVADLEAAGLNPILSANSGAAGYSGAMASIAKPTIDTFGAGQAGSSAKALNAQAKVANTINEKETYNAWSASANARQMQNEAELSDMRQNFYRSKFGQGLLKAGVVGKELSGLTNSALNVASIASKFKNLIPGGSGDDYLDSFFGSYNAK